MLHGLDHARLGPGGHAASMMLASYMWMGGRHRDEEDRLCQGLKFGSEGVIMYSTNIVL